MLSILYFTGLWAGLEDVLYEGQEPRGMPGFIRPLRALVERGHEVRLLVATPKVRPPDPGVAWLDPSRVIQVPWKPKGKLSAVPQLWRLYRRVRETLARQRFDFVYGQGTVGAIGVLAARHSGVRCGQRLYGVSYLVEQFRGRKPSPANSLRVMLSSPLHYLAFSQEADFLLVTRDGSGGDEVHRHIGNRGTEFLLWCNGVDHPPPDEPSAEPLPVPDDQPFLLYPNRIASFKRQDRVVELLAILKRDHNVRLRVVLAGHVSEPEYFELVQRQLARKELEDQVVFLGPVGQSMLTRLYRVCLAVPSFYDVSNLGNVTIEALAHGAAVIALNDGSLSGIIVDGESGFLVDDMEQAAAVVARLTEDPVLLARVRQGARAAADRVFGSWEERVEREISKIEAVAARGPRRGAVR